MSAGSLKVAGRRVLVDTLLLSNLRIGDSADLCGEPTRPACGDSVKSDELNSATPSSLLVISLFTPSVFRLPPTGTSLSLINVGDVVTKS